MHTRGLVLSFFLGLDVVTSFMIRAPLNTVVPLTRTVCSATVDANASRPPRNHEDIDDVFYKAVQEAEAAVTVSDKTLDEWDRLATALEEYCTADDGPCEGAARYEGDSGDDAAAEKEIQDRLDVAEILRLKIELQLRLNYLKNANLFADDVKKEHDSYERKKFKEALIENREKAPGGSDLGLW